MSPITAVLIGAGARGQVYANYARQHPEELRIAAVAEPRPDRRALLCDGVDIPQEMRFETWEPLLEKPRLADAALICTMDGLHTAPALAALEKGYHILLEKPMSSSEAECRAIARAAAQSKRVLCVCHVLRYTPFFGTLKALADSGEAGELASITQIENVAFWHYAHSFVRGNWRSAAQSSPMLLQKSCHDMDLLLWLMGRRCTAVSSFGSLRYFDVAHAPADAPPRCTDGCPHAKTCVYDARRLYLNGNTGWPVDMLTTDLTPQGIEQALREGPYGRCVYRCDNDVVDRQVVNLEFEGGALASFTMTAFTTDAARQLKLTGTKAQIEADMERGTILLHRFGESAAQQIPVRQPRQSDSYGHGGGDYFLMRDFVRAVRSGGAENRTDAAVSLQGHLICFAAEESRTRRCVVPM